MVYFCNTSGTELCADDVFVAVIRNDLSSDFFTVEMDVRDSAGNVIAKASATGSSASEWKTMTLPLSYVDVTKKAASVYVSFKSSGQSSHSCKTSGEYLEIAGQKKEGDPYRIKLSATLRIDDIQLNY